MVTRLKFSNQQPERVVSRVAVEERQTVTKSRGPTYIRETIVPLSEAIISSPHDRLVYYPLPYFLDRDGTQTRFHCWKSSSINWYCLESTGEDN